MNSLLIPGLLALLIFIYTRVRLSLKPLVFILISFVLSRLIFFVVGIRFDFSSLDSLLQVLDPELLRNRLFESLFYSHGQPPGFNLLLGIVLKIARHGPEIVLHGIYLACGALSTAAIFQVMIKLSVPWRLAGVLTLIFIFSPASILYENWLFYTYPVMTLLCLAAMWLYRFLSSSKTLDGFMFFMSLAAIALIRSVFHLAWFLFFVALLIIMMRPQWKKILLAALIPFLLVFAVYFKNLQIFGNFTSSTWLGMSLANLTTERLSEEKREAMIEQGSLSEIARVDAFRPLSEYPERWRRGTKLEVPALTEAQKSTGFPNLNHIAYIDISKQYAKDALTVIKEDPWLYLRSVGESFRIYFYPASRYSYLLYNSIHMENYTQLHATLIGGLFRARQTHPVFWIRETESKKFLSELFSQISFFTILIFLAGIGNGLHCMASGFFVKYRDYPFLGTLTFLVLNILYVTLLCNLVERGENNRFYFMIEPFVWILLGVFLSRWVKKTEIQAK